MVKIRLSIIAAFVIFASAPSVALAQIDALSIAPNVRLGPEGASATAAADFNCTSGLEGNLSVTIAQNNGGKLTSGGGSHR